MNYSLLSYNWDGKWITHVCSPTLSQTELRMARDHLRMVNGEKQSVQMELDRVKVYGIGMYYYSMLLICPAASIKSTCNFQHRQVIMYRPLSECFFLTSLRKRYKRPKIT